MLLWIFVQTRKKNTHSNKSEEYSKLTKNKTKHFILKWKEPRKIIRTENIETHGKYVRYDCFTRAFNQPLWSTNGKSLEIFYFFFPSTNSFFFLGFHLAFSIFSCASRYLYLFILVVSVFVRNGKNMLSNVRPSNIILWSPHIFCVFPFCVRYSLWNLSFV